MARVGISYTEVAEAASILVGQQQLPTVDKIRELLKTGSKSTILRHLTAWRRQAPQENQEKGSIPTELQGVVQGLWDYLQQQAIDKIEVHEQQRKQQMTELTAQLAAAQQQQQSDSSQINGLNQELRQVTEQKSGLEKSLNNHQQQITELQTRYQGLTQHSEQQNAENLRLHQLLKTMQANLEHYQAAIEQQQQQQNMVLDQQRSDHEQQLKALQQQLSDNQQKYEQLRTDCLATEQDLVQQQYINQSQQQQLTQLKATHSELTQQRQQLTQQSQDLQLKNTEQQQQCLQQQQHIAVLDNDLMHFKQQSKVKDQEQTKLQKKIEVLQHEKQMLLKQKHHLAGKVEQLQYQFTKQEGECHES